jgi:hypothetical protein
MNPGEVSRMPNSIAQPNANRILHLHIRKNPGRSDCLSSSPALMRSSKLGRVAR